jgi:hypothetical protein
VPDPLAAAGDQRRRACQAPSPIADRRCHVLSARSTGARSSSIDATHCTCTNAYIAPRSRLSQRLFCVGNLE